MKVSELKISDQQINKILILLLKGHRVELKRKGNEIQIITITRKKEN